MTKRIVAIAGVFPACNPRASRLLRDSEPVPREHQTLMLPELEEPVYIHDVGDTEAVCYLPKDEVIRLRTQHGWDNSDFPS